jgi:putative endonuclease
MLTKEEVIGCHWLLFGREHSVPDFHRYGLRKYLFLEVPGFLVVDLAQVLKIYLFVWQHMHWKPRLHWFGKSRGSSNFPANIRDCMSKHLETGRTGEQMAADWLVQRGFEVLERNYRHLKAEIDLIVRKSNLLVFVEVKTRSDTAFGLPEAAVTPAKAALIVAAAEQYICSIDWPHEIRFDIVSVLIQGKSTEIEHLEDAFY